MMIKCSKCDRPTPITHFHTAKVELCLDCAIEALNLLPAQFPSLNQFINRWCEKKG